MNVRHIRLACAGGQLLQWTLLFETLIKNVFVVQKKKSQTINKQPATRSERTFSIIH